MENEVNTQENAETPENIYAAELEAEKAKKRAVIIAIIIAVIIIAGLTVFAIFLLSPGNKGTTATIRDVFIIFMALFSLVLGGALIILILQLATLINLLQNEIKPILESTTETVHTLQGTATFISNNLTEPVIKLNQFVAMIKRMFDLFTPAK